VAEGLFVRPAQPGGRATGPGRRYSQFAHQPWCDTDNRMYISEIAALQG
jgi:hypothetical protein